MRTKLLLALSSLLFLAPGWGCTFPSGSAEPHRSPPASREPSAVPWELRPGGWRTDPIWHDGKAERCVYEARRPIYGIERRYEATAYTNVQHMDPGTTVKSQDASGVAVFKHHWSERVPTERYDYDFSTAAFVERDDLAPFKLTAGTQEDCGASFKQIWQEGPDLAWLESVYFPGAGLRQGRLQGRALVFEDALPLVLRDFPFSETPGSLELAVLPSQKTTRRASFEPLRMRIVACGKETLALPAGRREAWRLDLFAPGEERPRVSYWFAAEGAAPWLHALLRLDAADGASYRLRSLERTAYWERG